MTEKPDQGHERERADGVQVPQMCAWIWTPEDNSGFWTAQCKEDWPIQMLHEGAKFCAFCGGQLMVEGEK